PGLSAQIDVRANIDLLICDVPSISTQLDGELIHNRPVATRGTEVQHRSRPGQIFSKLVDYFPLEGRRHDGIQIIRPDKTTSEKFQGTRNHSRILRRPQGKRQDSGDPSIRLRREYG